MSNPVFNRLEKEWNQPAQANLLYSSTSGATPNATDGQYPYSASTSPDGQTSVNPEVDYNQAAFSQLQQAYAAPAADAVDTGRMTHEDVVMKTAISLFVLIVGGTLSWWATSLSYSVGLALMTGGLLVGLVLAMVNIFSKTIRPALILAYAAAEGVALGALSAVTEAAIPGVVIQAVIATAVVFGVTLLLFSSGVVRNSPKLMKFTLIALLGIILSRVVIWVLGSIGWIGTAAAGTEPTIFGLPLGLVISLVAVVIGTLCLISDFDQAKVGVEQGAPAKYAWSCAFGIMITVVWLYVEILNIFARINSN